MADKPAASIDYAFQTPSSSTSVCRINVKKRTSDERLAVLSLQGIVNKKKAEVYTFVNQDAWLFDFYRERGVILKDSLYTDPYQLLARFRNRAKGIVVYDLDQSHTINLATNSGMHFIGWNGSN